MSDRVCGLLSACKPKAVETLKVRIFLNFMQNVKSLLCPHSMKSFLQSVLLHQMENLLYVNAVDRKLKKLIKNALGFLYCFQTARVHLIMNRLIRLYKRNSIVTFKKYTGVLLFFLSYIVFRHVERVQKVPNTKIHEIWKLLKLINLFIDFFEFSRAF